MYARALSAAAFLCLLLALLIRSDKVFRLHHLDGYDRDVIVVVVLDLLTELEYCTFHFVEIEVHSGGPYVL